MSYIRCHTLDVIGVVANLDHVRARTFCRAYFVHHGMATIAGKPIDDCADHEVSSEVLRQAVELISS